MMKLISNAPPPINLVRGMSVPRSQSNGNQVHQVHKPDWSMWSGDQWPQIEEAVALTMDIDPAPLPRIQGFITPESFPEARQAEFSKRQLALQRLLPGRSSCMLSEAVDFAIERKWPGLPPELVGMAVLSPPMPPQGVKALAIAPDEPAPTLGTLSEPVKKQEPPPLTTPEIAEAFDGLGGYTTTQWRNFLGNVKNHKWLLPVRAARAKAPNPAAWWPLDLANLLLKRGESGDCLNRAFLNAPKLKPWQHLWQEQRRERNAFGQ